MPPKEFGTYLGVIHYLSELYEGTQVGNPRQASIYRNAAKKLSQWVKDGEPGVCPVILSQHGVKYIGPTRGNAAAEPFARPAAEDSVNDQIGSWSAEGDRLRQAGDFAGAEEFYRRVLARMPEDVHAIEALRDCKERHKTVNARQLKRLLKSTDFKELEEGIRLAKLADDGDELTELLRELLSSATQKSEDKRRADGQITTRMHVNNLEESKKVVDHLTNLVVEEPQFYDSQIVKWIPTAQALKDAIVLWEQRSAEAYQKLSDKFQKDKLKTPRLAADELATELEKPFKDQHKQSLRNLYEECRDNAGKKDAADVKAAAAESAVSEPVNALRLWCEAMALWPHVESRVARVDEAKRLAASWCVVQIREWLRQAEQSDNAANDRDKYLDRVEQLISDWPRDPRYRDVADTPAQFVDLGTKARLVRDQIKEQRNLDNEFGRFVAGIRRLVRAGSFSDALDEMKVKEGDAGYAERPEFRELFIEVGAGLSLGEQFERYSEVLDDSPEFVEEWVLKHRTGAGHLLAAMDELLGKARLYKECTIVRGQVESLDFEGAAQTIRALRDRLETPAQKRAMRELLNTEIQRIKVANEQHAMKTLFNDAELLRSQPNASWKMLEKSMRLFQHVGGRVVDLETGTPAFAESWFLRRARDNADEVRGALRAKLDENFSAVTEFELMIEISERLLQYYPLEFDRDSVRAALVARAQQHVAQLAEAGADGEIGVWERLDGPWPGADVGGWLECAKARQEEVEEALKLVERAMAGNDPQKALQICAGALQLVTSQRLTDRRESIFHEIEPVLLARIRRCGATSPDSVIGLALLAVEHLENFEEAAERDPAQRNSVVEFQRLKVRLEAHRLVNLLAEVRTVYGKLQVVDGLPMEDGAPQQSRDWSRAIISNEWLEHDGVVAYAVVVGLGDLRDIQSLMTNVRGYKAVLNSIRMLRDKLRTAFLAECFGDALTALQALNQLRVDRVGSDVLSAYESEVNVLDRYVGLQNVGEAARRLRQELQFWEEWEADCTRFHAEIATAWQHALGVVAETGCSLTGKQAAFSAFVDASQNQELRKREAGANPPVADSEIYKVREHSATGRRLLQVCEQWRTESQQEVDRYTREIEALGGFPTRGSFGNAANALVLNRASPMFRDTLERARVIGASSEAERLLLAHFKVVYTSMMQSKTEGAGWSWVLRLLRLLRLQG